MDSNLAAGILTLNALDGEAIGDAVMLNGIRVIFQMKIID